MDPHSAKSASSIHPETLETSEYSHAEEPQRNSSPIASMSEELLILILDMVRDSFDLDDSGRRRKLPIVASHVSRFWRSVALENGLWWSDIVIIYPWKEEFLKLCLQRSKQCLLNISILDHTIEDENGLLPTSKEYQCILDLLFPYLARCRVLTIRDEGRDIPSPFLEQFQSVDLPCLEKFTFEGEATDYERFFHQRELMALFPSAPRLRDIRLLGVGIEHFIVPPCSPPVNPPPLTSLHLSRTMDGATRTPFSELKRTLEACPLLDTLAIYGNVLGEWPGLHTSCNVPSLETLYILSNMLTVSELLLFLIAPQLKELVIAPIVISDLGLLVSQSRTNPGLIQQRFPVLRSLTLAIGYRQAFDAVNSASICFPHVDRLTLANLYSTPFALHFTTQDSFSGFPIFPNLLYLALTDVDETIIQIIYDVQMFRAGHNLPLRTVYLDSASFEKAKIYLDLDGILSIEEGEGTLNLQFMEANIWEVQRRKLLHSENKSIFVGV
ncbi:hypothetical protein GALMADRAFT_252258 [Galerina marginata CBS 339.88]|uniref:F-box domain-containing protein n=1 Tax=Galerina marginata (strain CBS 339.88) TaxID=685588 RepID=A0A067T1M9_GALM3|nr:hypothetical protein GALMADRAFT_252258 [Galerina marginata CBS 339.88]